MKYYNFEDIIELTGCSQSKAYEIIRKQNEQYKKKYPESISIRGRVPNGILMKQWD
ncbi:MAG: transcriptional regulator [Bacilli bacterium]|nr:transcriptional regulator [Bacilli bacterium]